MFHPEGIPLGSFSQLSFTLLLTFFSFFLGISFFISGFFSIDDSIAQSGANATNRNIRRRQREYLDFFCCIFFSFPWGNILQTICARGSDPLWKKSVGTVETLLLFCCPAARDLCPCWHLASRPFATEGRVQFVCVCVCNTKIERTGGNGSGRVPPIYPACAVMYTHTQRGGGDIYRRMASLSVRERWPMRKRPAQLVV